LTESYEQLGNLFLEVILLFGPMKKFIQKQVDFLGYENWVSAKNLGHGVIVLSSHLGNWEVMAAAGGVLHQIDAMIVTKILKPSWFHRLVENGRKNCGISGTYEPRTLKDVLKQLSRGETVGFVLDQYAGAPIGVRVPFFGVPVGTANVVAAIAKRTGAPVLPVINYRKPDGRFHVEIQSPLQWIEDPSPHKELALNTAHYVRVLEGHIRQRPAQWLWIHRRFKGDLSPLREDEWEQARIRRNHDRSREKKS